MMFATLAIPFAVRQREFRVYCSAHATHLATRKPLVNFDKNLSALSEFVLQKCSEHTKAVIVRGLAKFERTRHAAKIDILNTDVIPRVG